MKIRDLINDVWNKVTVIIAVPLGIAFMVLGMFGKLCLEKLPYLVC